MPVLQFKGKTAVECYHYTVPHHTLEFDKKLSVLEKGQKPSLDGNLIIEGDNLLALKALLPTHAGRVKCIYIDPPYNTGNEGWVYNDNLTQPQFKEWLGQTVGKEGEDACRHDKWCCMMYPRLQLLKELLREDGSIWVSIDDNEFAHLRMLMDEVFGEHNFIATVVWRNATGPKQSNTLSTSHEYVVAYAKEVARWKVNLLPRTAEQESDYTNRDNDPRGPWRDSGLDARNYYSRGTYAIKCPGGRVIPEPPEGRYWGISEDTLWELDAEGRIWWGDDKNNVPRLKRFLSEAKAGVIPQTVWDYDEVGHTQEAKQDYLRVLSGIEVFTTPKTVGLVDRILQITTAGDDIVFDSFAGSGTSGQAVLERNKADGGRRRFVLVQLRHDSKEHEKDGANLCERMTAERVRRVIEGYSFKRRAGKGEWKKVKVDGLPGSFTYARLGPRLFGEYRDLGDKLPAFEELAKYIFYTESSHEFDAKAMDAKTGRIGEHKRTAYYLLYTPSKKEAQPLDLVWLKEVAAKEKCPKLVVYCEKLWMHHDDLLKWQRENKRSVRPMIVPFSLK